MRPAGLVAFRVDASPVSGSGHLYRCLALASELRRREFRSIFVVRFLPPQLQARILAAGHELERLAAPAATAPANLPDDSWLGATRARDAEETAQALGGVRPDWLVIDHYAVDYRWEELLSGVSARLMVIDDLADRKHQCDLLLDQNLHVNAAARYAKLVGENCRLLLGPRYALLRPEFARLRSALRMRDGGIRRIVVFFGGTDSRDYTSLALDSLDRLARTDISVDVVIGPMHPRRALLESRCSSRRDTRVFVDVPSLADLIAQADLALGAGGLSVWERCCLGVPTIAVATADNQRQQLEELAERAVAICLSAATSGSLRDALTASVSVLLGAESLMRGMSRRCQELVDGRGAERAVAAMLSTDLELRAATSADCRLIYEWRNHPDIRCRSREPAEIAWDAHESWYRQTLANPDRVLLLAGCSMRPIGVVRFDITGDCAEVSIYLAPEELAGGWGAAVLSRSAGWLRRQRPDVRQIVARILPENLASRGAFAKAGFYEDAAIFIKKLK